MIDDCVRDDLDTSIAASTAHFLELLLVARARRYVVTHGLVSGPPLVSLDVLHGRRDLDGLEALGSEKLLAFRCYVGPRPLKQVDKCTWQGEEGNFKLKR